MFNAKTVSRLRVSLTWLAVASMLIAVLLPLMNSQSVSAGQITSRKVTMSTSDTGSTSDYDFSFALPSGTHTIGSIAIEACTNSPVPGVSCTQADTDNFDISTGTFANGSGWTSNTGSIAEDTAAPAEASIFLIDDSDPDNDETGTITFSIDGVTNPDTAGTLYLRLFVFDAAADNNSYTSGDSASDAGADHDGAIALAILDQLTVEAVVQEVLTVCLGNTDPAAQCAAYAGSSAIDLGVLSSGSINTSLANTLDSNLANAYIMVLTNANSGILMTYFADEMGVSGAGCTGEDRDTGAADATDRCLDYDKAAQTENNSEGTAIVAGTEQYGWAVVAHTADGSDTTNAILTSLNAAYNDIADAGEYSFDPTSTAASPVTVTSTTGVVDSEQFEMEHAATINLTTPSGLYQTAYTFVVTGTF